MDSQKPPEQPLPREEASSASYPDPIAQFTVLSQNYLRMLSAPAPEASASSTVPPPVPQSLEHINLDAMLSEIIKESPALIDTADFAIPPSLTFTPNNLDAFDLFASPLISDYDPTSPLFTPGRSLDTSPQMMDSDNPIGFPNTSPLFADSSFPPADNGMDFNMPMYSFSAPHTTPALVDDSSPLIADLGGNHSPSLKTPLNAVGYSSPLIADATSSPKERPTKPLPHRRQGPTGTRKNVTPDTLLPLDAPTQSKNYIHPSSTSRKEVPATFARRRTVSSTNKDDDDYLPDLPANATELEQIEWKRRQNTIAARKSRKRKLEHQQYLEAEVDRLTREKEVWRTRAVTLKAVLVGRGEAGGLEWDGEE